MTKVQFRAIIEIRDANPYVLVSHAHAASLRPDWRKPMPVLVQVNGMPINPWHINMMPVGDGSFYLYLHGDVRKASETGVGDTVEIRLDFDKAYHSGPMHPMPDWFARALDQNDTAKENWNSLIPSRQKEVLRYLTSLKSDEAKERNLAKVVSMLSGKTGRFMARDWKEGK